MNTHEAFSVLIIVKGRRKHLLNQLAGIAQSNLQPAEIIIVHMNEPAAEAAVAGLTVPVHQFNCVSKHVLPLAEARNMAAAEATTGTLLFLDVDCIPAADCFERLLADLPPDGLCMADPRYLQQPLDAVDVTILSANAQPNPARPADLYGPSDAYALFWSLGFIVGKRTFETIGGFDPSFIGYGGEDTDFAFSACDRGVPLFYSNAQVYHQTHPSYDPPLNWLEDIITNAQVFRRKWRVWPMEGWLRKFQTGGYISWDDDSIELLRLPTEAEIAATRKPGAL